MAKMKIMVVDDNTVNLATIEQELKDKYEVIPMLTGRRAVKYLYRDKVDLILLDVQMPIMDGLETLKEIRTHENGVTVPVVFLTSKKDTQTVLEGSKLGIMDYITKPFDTEDLKERIERVFKRLGVLPMEQDELYDRINAIRKDLDAHNVKPAILKTEEVLRFQMEEDVSGRMRNAKMKMEKGNMEGALIMVERVLNLLERNLIEINKALLMPISLEELSARFLYIEDDLKNFKIHDASDKLTALKEYDISEKIRKDVNLIVDKLKEYDDAEAEEIVGQIIEELDKEKAADAKADKNLGQILDGIKREIDEESKAGLNNDDIGYHSKRLRHE